VSQNPVPDTSWTCPGGGVNGPVRTGPVYPPGTPFPGGYTPPETGSKVPRTGPAKSLGLCTRSRGIPRYPQTAFQAVWGYLDGLGVYLGVYPQTAPGSQPVASDLGTSPGGTSESLFWSKKMTRKVSNFLTKKCPKIFQKKHVFFLNFCDSESGVPEPRYPPPGGTTQLLAFCQSGVVPLQLQSRWRRHEALLQPATPKGRGGGASASCYRNSSLGSNIKKLIFTFKLLI